MLTALANIAYEALVPMVCVLLAIVFWIGWVFPFSGADGYRPKGAPGPHVPPRGGTAVRVSLSTKPLSDFQRELVTIMANRELTIRQVAQRTGASLTTVRYWLDGVVAPYPSFRKCVLEMIDKP